MADDQPTIPGGPRDRGRGAGPWARRSDPTTTALVGRHGRYSWRELDVEVNRAAHALRALGVEPGHRVAVALPNDVDIVIAFLACMRLGAIWLGVNTRAGTPARRHTCCATREPTVVLATPAARDRGGKHAQEASAGSRAGGSRRTRSTRPTSGARSSRHRIAERARGRASIRTRPAALAYTSGTTGHPKGALHSQHNLLLPGAVARARRAVRREDRVGVVLPLTLVNLIALGPLLAWQTGATCVAIDRVDAPGLAAWIRTERVTAISTVPTIMHALLTDPGRVTG